MTTTITARQVTEIRAIALLTECCCYFAEVAEYYPEECPKHRLIVLADELDPPLAGRQAIV